MHHIIMINGKKVSSDIPCISVFDRGLTLGHGLFETILINNGSAKFLSYHWKRLRASSKLIGIKIPFTLHDLKNMIFCLVKENNLTDKKAALRLTITDGISARGILPNGEQSPTYILSTSPLPEKQTPHMSAKIVTTRKNENSLSSKIKSISYIDNIIAKKEAISDGFDEAFLLNSKSFLADGAVANIFIVNDNKIYTPRVIDGALPGIVRHVIINKLMSVDLEICEKQISQQMLFNSNEIFITNALLGVVPISKMGAKILSNEFTISNKIRHELKNQFNYP